MISAFFTSAGRMMRTAIILGALLSAAALMVLGAKVSGWFTDAQQMARASQLNEREAELKAAEQAARDKREAELSRRENALSGLAAKEAAKVADAQAELARVKAETARLEEIARKYAKRADEAQKRAAALEAKADAPVPVQTPVVAPVAAPVVAPVARYAIETTFHNYNIPAFDGSWTSWDDCIAALGRRAHNVNDRIMQVKSVRCVPVG